MTKLMKQIFILIVSCATLCFAGCGKKNAETKSLTLFVAASLTDVIQEISAEFKKEHNVEIFHNFGSSGALAQQILASPRADLFFSADQRWMNEVANGGRIKDGTRRTLLSNRLVVIGHRSSTWELEDPAALSKLPFRFLAIGDPASVPAGKYAKTWLESLKGDGGNTLWNEVEVQGRISPAPDVRAALAQVEARSDVIGIVYGTDYSASGGKVRVIWEVQDGPKIEYPVAILSETPEAKLAAEFLTFLRSPEARKLFEKHGFAVVE